MPRVPKGQRVPASMPEAARLEEALQEGARLASRALSRLLPKARLSIEEAQPLCFSPAGAPGCVAVCFSFEGAWRGRLAIAADEGSWRRVASALLARPAALTQREVRDALSELANIMASGFLDAFAPLAGGALMPSTPLSGPVGSEVSGAALATMGEEALRVAIKVEQGESVILSCVVSIDGAAP